MTTPRPIAQFTALLIATGTASGTAAAQCVEEAFEFVDSGQSLANRATSAITLGDVDGDGDLDAMAANGGYPGIPQSDVLWINEGDGSFTESGQTIGNGKTTAIVLEDLDQDGDLDALFMRSGFGWPPPPHRIWFNDGEGTFTDSGQAIQTYYSAVDVGDLDRDGDPDLMFSNYDASASIWLNDGAGVFSESAQAGPSLSSNGLILGDFDGDEDLDAFVFQELTFPNTILLNDGTGNFSSSGQWLANGNATAADAGDVDGDGDLDLLVSHCCTGGDLAMPEASVVWINDGTGTFTEARTLESNVSSRAMFEDLDRDGDLDIVEGLWNFPDESYYITWINDGFGNFTTCGKRFGEGRGVLSLGDLDGDGDPDAMFAGVAVNDYEDPARPNSVAINRPPCTGDLDGNAEVGGADLTVLLGAWGANPTIADLNVDGFVDGADLAIILANWGAKCAE
ncbi:MAG: FG-GAP-like repeat-containing protein [Planctomycetota bacterium]|nr:FG-GAP-like repeat-containing protein [Planctomycetota bacterium]